MIFEAPLRLILPLATMNDTFTVMYFPFYRSLSRVDALQNIVNVPMTATIPEVQDLI